MTIDIDLAALEKDLIGWIADWTEDGGEAAVDPDTDLAGTGQLDSMGLVALISYLEDETGRTFDFGTFQPGGGVSVRSLIRHCLA